MRECGERTANTCVALLQRLFPKNEIHRVSDRPFSATLRRSLEKGLQEGRPWLLCIDADVLIMQELTEFIAEMARMPDDVFVGQALVVDKLLPSQRPAGNHLYRVRFIPTALTLIPTENVLRPETEMIQAMRTRGFLFRQSQRIVGLHDFEQYYLDIYSKAFLHSKKHGMLMHLTEPVWQYLSQDDIDFRIALTALGNARLDATPPEVSRDFRHAAAKRALGSLTLQEKLPLDEDSGTLFARLIAKPVDHGDPMFNRNLADLQALIDKHIFPAEAANGWSVKRYFLEWARRLLGLHSQG